MKCIHVMIAGIAFFSHSCAQPKAEPTDYSTIFAKQFKEDLKSDNVAGASYAVFDTSKTVWQDSYGFAHKKTNENTSIQTRYLIGSVTKVFTAVAILQLHEKNIINIDSCVSKYLPELRIKQRFPDSQPITIRDVLTHHAGLPTDIFIHKFSEHPPRFESVLDYLNNQTTCFPVNKIKSYSNIGYALLGIIVEKTSRLPYITYIRQNIFSPLSMRNSDFYCSKAQSPLISDAYDVNGNENCELPIFDVPAGAVYSTVEDMVKFGKSFLKNGSPILKPETIKLMFELQNDEVKADLFEKSAICLNYKNKTAELGRILEHGGATMYHRAEFYLAPDAGLGAVMLSNSTNGVKNAWKLNEQFMVEYSKKHSLKVPANTIPAKNFDLTSTIGKNLQAYTGDYVMPGMNCSLQWKNNHLFVSIQGNTFYLIPEDNHSFVAAKRVMGIMFKSKEYHFFLENINGEKLFIQAMPWGELSIIGKKTHKQIIPSYWKKRIGKYEITNQDKTELPMINNIEVIEKNGFLILQYKFNAISNSSNTVEMTLEIADTNKAYTDGLSSGGGESVVFTKNDTFEYYGLNCKRINQ